MATNVSRATATYLPDINPGSWTYPAYNLDNSGYSSSADDGTGRPTVYRQAWWTFIPSADGSVGLEGDSYANPPARIEHRLYRYDGTTLTLIEAPTRSDPVTPVAVTAGTRYYLMIGTPTDASASYGFGIYGPTSAPDPGAAPAAATNHHWNNATVIRPAADGTWSGSLDNTAADYTTPENNPVPNYFGGYRPGWFTVTPGADGTAVFTASAPVNCEIDLLSHDGSWSVLGYAYGTPTPTLSANLTAGVAYYLRVCLGSSDNGQIIALHATGITPVDTGVAATAITARVHALPAHPSTPTDRQAAPAARLAVTLRARITGETDTAAAAPFGVRVRISGGPLTDATVPPLGVGVAVAPPSTAVDTLTLTAPADGQILATALPDFIVALVTDEDTLTYTIEIQYADDAAFTDPVTLSQLSPGVDGGTIITATDPVPAAGFWRARLLLDGVQLLGWTDPAAFTVDTTVTPVTAAITFTVTPGAARPVHLWHFDPEGPTAGDPVTAYGQGFPTTGTLSIDGTALSVQSWTLVPASGVTGDDRVIDGDVVDAEHYEVVFTAPVLTGPGGALTVEA